MKYLTLAGLAALVALAMIAFTAAGSASATVLCKTYETPCPKDKDGKSEDYPAGTEIDASAVASVSIGATNAEALVTCTDSTFKGKTTNTGSATESVKGNIESLTFGGCGATIDVLAMGSYEINYVGPKTKGALIVKGVQVKVTQAFGSCVYGTSAVEFGEMTSEEGMESPELHGEMVLNEEEKKFLCPDTAVFTGDYKITSPKPLYFKKEAVA